MPYTNVCGIKNPILQYIEAGDKLTSPIDLDQVQRDLYKRLFLSIAPPRIGTIYNHNYCQDALYEPEHCKDVSAYGSKVPSAEVLHENFLHVRDTPMWQYVCRLTIAFTSVTDSNIFFSKSHAEKGSPFIGMIDIRPADSPEDAPLVRLSTSLQLYSFFDYHVARVAEDASIKRITSYLDSNWEYHFSELRKKAALVESQKYKSALAGKAYENLTISDLCKLTGESKSRLRLMRAEGNLEAYIDHRCEDAGFSARLTQAVVNSKQE